MFDEYFKNLNAASNPIAAATLPPPNTIGASSSTTLIDKDAPSLITSPNIEATNSPLNSINVETNEKVDMFDSDTFTNPFAPPDTSSVESSSRNVEDKILFPKPPKNYARCAKCGHPVNGHYCQGCALLREKLEEDLITYLKYFHDTSESSDDSTNVVNAPREPFVVKQDHGVKYSQNPPPIDECCCECGDALDGIFCQQCICKSCGKGAHTGYNCPPKFRLSLIQNQAIKPSIMSSHKLCQVLIQFLAF
nr:hypothetical protein [Tanacetum cinerariifolium]